MRYPKALIITLGILLFLVAVTFCLNRYVLPQVIRKIAIEKIEEATKRKVEIGSITFNWFKGFIIDNVKLYEKPPRQGLFLEARQVSFGVLIFPGFQQTRITIPFINILSPSVHLVHTGPDTWNFSDLLASSSASPAAKAPAGPRSLPAPSGVEIAWGGITVTDGEFLIDEAASPHPWSEHFENISLKLTLSLKDVNCDFTAEIPQKKGLLGAKVEYKPDSQDIHAQIHLRNIDTAPYLALVNIPQIHMTSGVIEDIRLDLSRSGEKMSAEGDVSLRDLDLSRQDQAFKGDVQVRRLNAQYLKGHVTAKGELSLKQMQAKVQGILAGGSVEAKVTEFEWDTDKMSAAGSLRAHDLLVSLKNQRLQAAQVSVDSLKVSKDHDAIQAAATADLKGLFVQLPEQTVQGDFSLRDLDLRMKDVNDITLEGTLRADNMTAGMGEKHLTSRHLTVDSAKVTILNQKDMTLSTNLSLDDMVLVPAKNMLVSGSLKTTQLAFKLAGNTVQASTNLKISKGKLVLDRSKTVQVDPQLELTIDVPLKSPEKMTYKGSITFSDAGVRGFAPIQSLDHIDLDADFDNDKATINALGAQVMDTNVHATGTVMNFKAPVLNVVVETEELNLAKIKDLAPQFVEQYGLDLDGTGSVKLKFEGAVSDWMSGKILAVASVKNASAASSKFHQRLKNITGIIEATPDSLKIRDFTAVYLDKKYGLTCSLTNFKNPKISAAIDGPDIQLEATASKKGDTVTVDALKGKYMNTVFDAKGTVTLVPAKAPEFDVSGHVSFLLENIVKMLPEAQQKSVKPLNPTGMINLSASVKGAGSGWKNFVTNVSLSSPELSLMGYKFTDAKLTVDQAEGKVRNATLDGKLYDGTVHAVGSLDLSSKAMPYELALNLDGTDLQKLKMDSSLKAQDIQGKFYLTTMAHGTVDDLKNKVQATGSLAIRDGHLAEFDLFKGLLSTLNQVLGLGQVTITDVEGNFTIQDQKFDTQNMRLQGPTIVLLAKGWVNFDQLCDLHVTVDLSSGVVPPIAHDVLSSLDIHIYDKIGKPKFDKKISAGQVINTVIKNLPQILSAFTS